MEALIVAVNKIVKEIKKAAHAVNLSICILHGHHAVGKVNRAGILIFGNKRLVAVLCEEGETEIIFICPPQDQKKGLRLQDLFATSLISYLTPLLPEHDRQKKIRWDIINEYETAQQGVCSEEEATAIIDFLRESTLKPVQKKRSKKTEKV